LATVAEKFENSMQQSGFSVPSELPLGPWDSFDDAFHNLKIWALEQGFPLILQSAETAPTSKAGAKRQVSCKFNRATASTATKRASIASGDVCSGRCQFFCRLEHTSGGWALLNMNPNHCEHSFEPRAKAVAAQLAAGDSKIPKALLELGETLSRANSSAAEIDRVLRAQAKHENIELTWTLDDVYNHFRRAGDPIEFDADTFCKILKLREEEHGLPCEFWLSKHGELRAAFWMNTKGFEHWAALRNAKCVLYDTKHGTNRYRLKLGCWTVVDSDGKTQIIAFSLVPENEPKEAFIWAFEQFRRHLGEPTCMFTDGDIGMAGAVKKVFPSAVHLLCVYHIYTNLFKHMKPLFGGTKGNPHWRAFVDMFWKIARRTERRSRAAFDQEWAQLTRMAETHSANHEEKARKLALEWLASLGKSREQWAARWTWQHLTLEIHSTQRAEAIHSAIAQILKSSDSLQVLFEKLDAFESDRTVRQFMERRRRQLIHVRTADQRARAPPHCCR
jgi:hypothetical protein